MDSNKNSRTPKMVILVLGAMGLLFLLQLANLAWPGGELRIRPGDVRGIEVVHKETFYTLNFDQQNNLLAHLNRAVVMQHLSKSPTPLPEKIEKIIIHRFDKEQITVTPVLFDDGNTFFLVPEWQPTGYLVDLTGYLLANLLDSCHD